MAATLAVSAHAQSLESVALLLSPTMIASDDAARSATGTRGGLPDGRFHVLMTGNDSVRLCGTVASARDRRVAVRAVKSLYGVSQVQDDLTIAAP